MGQNHSDNFQTPTQPVVDLINYIKEHGTFLKSEPKIWEPACGKGRMLQTFRDLGYTAYGSDILNGIDFLKDTPDWNYNWIITNPPFSLKDQFLKRCYELKVPFALLLPIQALSGIKRSLMFKEHGLQVLVLPKRVDFEYEDGSFKGKPWFSCAWYTHGFGLKKDLDWL